MAMEEDSKFLNRGFLKFINRGGYDCDFLKVWGLNGELNRSVGGEMFSLRRWKSDRWFIGITCFADGLNVVRGLWAGC